MSVFKQGDFVFAKIKGYRPWPARILEPGARHYNVFFYGTRQTGKVRPEDLYPYESYRLTFGNCENLRQKAFMRAMLQADLMFNKPKDDCDFYQILAVYNDSYEDTMSQEGESEDYEDDYDD